jgi:Flp pilus assembly protein TadD
MDSKDELMSTQENSMTAAPSVANTVEAQHQQQRGIDRRYLVGLVAGALLGVAFGFPGSYALLRAAHRDPIAEAKAQDGARVAGLINQSLSAIQSGRLTYAVSLLSDAQRIDPRDENVHNNLCVAYTGLKRYDKAIEACNLALILKSDFQLARNNLAWASSERAKALAAKSRMPEETIRVSGVAEGSGQAESQGAPSKAKSR